MTQAAQPAEYFAMDASARPRRIMMFLLVLSFLIPAHLHFGSITMGFTRLYLLLAFFPCLVMFFRGKNFKINAVDILMVGFIIWATLSIMVNHGAAMIEFMGLQVVDMFGAYLLGRVLIQTPSDYRAFWRFFGYAMVVVAPVAAVELLTERFILHEILGGFLDVFDNATIGYPRRWGFDRVQGNFEHPILFGVFWGLGFASMLAVFPSFVGRAVFGGLCVALTAMSLSSGAYLVILFQVSLLMWAWATNNSWKLLLVLFAIFYIVLEIISDRSALVALSTRLAFSSGTAYTRVYIWTYGIQNVIDNPIFGLGLNPWVRPHWLTSSIDNNWLLLAVRGGFPTIFFLLAAFVTMGAKLITAKGLPKITMLYRRNFLITFVAMFIALGTVAVWSGTASFLFFLLGMGTSLPICRTHAATNVSSSAGEETPVNRYTRQKEFFDARGKRRGTSRA